MKVKQENISWKEGGVNAIEEENTFLYFINEQRNKGELITLPKDSLLSRTDTPTADDGGTTPTIFRFLAR